MSLLREIQSEIASRDANVTDLLLKCKILAARLKSQELAAWVNAELNGYPKPTPIPDYRKFSCMHYASFADAAFSYPKEALPRWIFPEEAQEQLAHVEFRQGIAEAAAFSSEDGAQIPRPEWQPWVQKSNKSANVLRVWTEIGGGNFVQLVSAVKSRILDFVLDIEAANPDAGEAPVGSEPIPGRVVHQIFHNHFHSPINNLAQGNEAVTQTINGMSAQEVESLVETLTAHRHQLSLGADERESLESQIQVLREQLCGELDQTKVSASVSVIRELVLGTVSNLIANAAQPQAYAWIHQLKMLLGIP